MVEEHYWDENLDPKTLRVIELRKILLENNVSFSGHDKKNDLVKLFKANVDTIRSNALQEHEAIPSGDKVVKSRHGKRKKGGNVSGDLVTGEIDMFESKVRKSLRTPSAGSVEYDSGLKTSSPFSDVNEFQKGPGSRKRKIDERDDGTYGDVDSSPKPIRKKKSKSHKKKTIKEVDGAEFGAPRSPIVNKVQTKRTPLKGEHHSLLINKFETSDDESSLVSTPTGKKVLVFDNEFDKLNAQDFTYPAAKRQATPDLSKLKVSPEFQVLLSKAQAGNKQQQRPESSSSTELSADISRPSVADSTADSNSGNKLTKRPKKTAERPKTTDGKGQSNSGPSTVTNTSFSTPDKKQTPRQKQKKQKSAPSTPKTVATKKKSTVLSPQKPSTDSKEEIVEEEHTDVKTGVKRPSLFKAFIKWLYSVFKKLLVFSLVVLPILFGLWYREQRVLVGYCGHSIDIPTFSNADRYPILGHIDDFLQKYKPDCLPCPENAICYPRMSIKCKSDYVITPSVFSLYGLFPVSDSCVKDSRKEKLIAEVVYKSLELLRTKNAQVQCGEGDNDVMSGISEEELRQIFFESKVPWMNEKEFREIWKQVIKDLKSQAEIVFRQVSIYLLVPSVVTSKTSLLTSKLQVPSGRNKIQDYSNDYPEAYGIEEQEGDIQYGEKEEYIRSLSKKYIGIRCQFERQIYRTYERFTVMFWGFIVVVVLIQLLKMRFQRHFKEQEIIEQLKSQVVEKLKASAKAEGKDSPKFLSTVQLRDVLLADVIDLKHKNQLWNKVVHKLESNNTNVKSMLMEVHGEIMKCWEWVGPIE
ncbi:HFL247Wp [Eremothecium sinecaudum]|uniref:HFL247Wp n=1 Tax=Eremothecium sinecaudum TaxID=45286 RepID=A0A0X8HUE3_9SACH|nr:HFL247Wp [Eremothecium sinecaudum]AMD21609.1 HFL247Wp [Eremothecium sinecaudum]